MVTTWETAKKNARKEWVGGESLHSLDGQKELLWEENTEVDT